MALERETLGFWERLMKFKDKHGYWNLTKLVLFVAFAVATLFLAKNFGESYSFERQKQVISEVMEENSQQMFIEHEEKMEQRRTIRPYVIDILKTTINEMGCGRAFVIELHNGSNNTAGLPFIHASMTYEVVARGIEPIDEDYQNISLTSPIDEFIEMDPKMGGRLSHNGATYLVITTIRSEKSEIGYFGFIYYKKNKLDFANQENMEFIVHSVQKLSKLLDKDSKTI